jgi:hypothetical protein
MSISVSSGIASSSSIISLVPHEPSTKRALLAVANNDDCLRFVFEFVPASDFRQGTALACQSWFNFAQATLHLRSKKTFGHSTAAKTSLLQFDKMERFHDSLLNSESSSSAVPFVDERKKSFVYAMASWPKGVASFHLSGSVNLWKHTAEGMEVVHSKQFDEQWFCAVTIEDTWLVTGGNESLQGLEITQDDHLRPLAGGRHEDSAYGRAHWIRSLVYVGNGDVVVGYGDGRIELRRFNFPQENSKTIKERLKKVNQERIWMHVPLLITGQIRGLDFLAQENLLVSGSATAGLHDNIPARLTIHDTESGDACRSISLTGDSEFQNVVITSCGQIACALVSALDAVHIYDRELNLLWSADASLFPLLKTPFSTMDTFCIESCGPWIFAAVSWFGESSDGSVVHSRSSILAVRLSTGQEAASEATVKFFNVIDYVGGEDGGQVDLSQMSQIWSLQCGPMHGFITCGLSSGSLMRIDLG